MIYDTYMTTPQKKNPYNNNNNNNKTIIYNIDILYSLKNKGYILYKKKIEGGYISTPEKGKRFNFVFLHLQSLPKKTVAYHSYMAVLRNNRDTFLPH